MAAGLAAADRLWRPMPAREGFVYVIIHARLADRSDLHELLASAKYLALVDDVVAVEHRTASMAGQHHRDSFRHARTHEISCRRPPAVMKEPARNADGGTGIRQCSSPRAYGHTVAAQLPPHLPRPVHLLILIPHTLNRRTQLIVARGSRRPSRGIPLLRLAQELRRRSDGRNRADRLDSVAVAMLIDERDHHFARRSSSDCAKNADAFRRISFAHFSSQFSGSSCFRRCRSSSSGRHAYVVRIDQISSTDRRWLRPGGDEEDGPEADSYDLEERDVV